LTANRPGPRSVSAARAGAGTYQVWIMVTNMAARMSTLVTITAMSAILMGSPFDRSGGGED
jgi:hypothetical protein